ncbi:hypothetical protein CAOG_04845 [Capsaspora owczarzaki ATCC 30864]|uniref:Palmitoyltransferase n=1 Tax=Capsaspora owczarzaki (strain ATCC 30864) TaxID=595528 RepID=A0A0D2UGH2_CAPO3|nr:hypothetical protein CAOG_04845 [Capsaspora owczarzaki ATCC 30864]KJE94161.1 hypothetical protein CAOG_004845 [Capsaspora owczarzaki ATCC 30864]|eukprot:XP_004347596.1 hypothetical protein CAOG_04845 [Capsaspora owczarzaki ATCC 30864]
MIIWFIIGAVGVFQVPLLVDILDNMLPSRRIGRMTHAVFNMLLFALVLWIHLVALWSFFVIFLPFHLDARAGKHLPTSSSSAAEAQDGGGAGQADPSQQANLSQQSVVDWLSDWYALGHIAVALFTWINSVANYTLAVFTSPVTGEWALPVPALSAPNAQAHSRGAHPSTTTSTARIQSSAPGLVSQATTASAASLYCRVCNRTIPYFDHHCPFTMNCVGLHNTVYFVSFLAYATLGLTFATHMSFGAFRECAWTAGGLRIAACQAVGDLSFVCLPSMLVAWCTLLLFLWQAALLALDTSARDFLRSIRKSPVQYLTQDFLPRLRDRLKLCFGRGAALSGESKPSHRFEVLIRLRKSSVWHFAVPHALPVRPEIAEMTLHRRV